MIDDHRRLMASRKDDERIRPREREIRRNCGQLLGRLDELLPCIYLAEYGATNRDMRGRMSDTAPGLFVVGKSVDSYVAPRVGLLLPVSLCRDEPTRAALLKIPPLLAGEAQMSVSDKRRQVQSCLDEAFGDDLRLTDRETLDGFCALTPSAAFFRLLHETFDYVTEVVDNPAGNVRIARTSPFPWRSYGELLEWYNLRVSHRFDDWSSLTPFLLCGDTGKLARYVTERWAYAGLGRPDEHPAKWFVIRPDLADARPVVRLEMGRYGWAYLHLGLDETSAAIDLSHVFDPFPELLAWACEIDEGDLPVEMEIDEEGTEAVLTVLTTNDPERVLLRVRRRGAEDSLLLEGVVVRSALAGALKAELRRFFTQEFDPRAWDEGDALKASMLAQDWLVSGD